MQLDQGQRLGDYVIRGPIGAGGMGEVYRAHDTTLDRDVAIKVLPRELSGHPDRRARFEREAKAVAALNHENIVVIHAIGGEDGERFLAMELVEGETLDRKIPELGLSTEELLAFAVPIASALGAAHAKSIVHRDLKPGNVMVTQEGRVKVLDFGLAKLAPGGGGFAGMDAEEAETAELTLQTAVGTLVGTLPYMSPEQLSGGSVGPQSDVFSMGVMLYEMATGRRPFEGSSNPELISSILTETPAPVGELKPALPNALGELIAHCLAKDPADRPSSADELCRGLETIRDASVASAEQPTRRVPGWIRVAAVMAVIGLLGGAAVWYGARAKEVQRARNVALPEIQELFDDGDRDAAFRLLRETALIIPGDPVLQELEAGYTIQISIDSEPSNAEISITSYEALDRPWISLGRTPLEINLPVEEFRVRVELAGYETFLGTGFESGEAFFELVPDGAAPLGMVLIPPGDSGFGGPESVELEPFWLDRFEVTNARYQEFVDAGGYRKSEVWQEPLVIDDRELAWNEAMAIFVDSTGRPGPAGWELSSYLTGMEDQPVGGISWYEASAFAVWSGSMLPTVHHWHRAAQQGLYSNIISVSNFDSDGPATVGEYQGIGPHGTFDMAGNVREWCFNSFGGARYILGGAWSDPRYMFRDVEAADPSDRSPRNGFRTMRTIGDGVPLSMAAIDDPVYDFRREEPVSDEVFEILRGFYAYDRTDLEAKIEKIDSHSEYWRRERVSFNAAYGGERVPAYLYLPKNAEPPYQTVVLFPSSAALNVDNSRNPTMFLASFIVRSGRALMYPIYQGTYERQIEIIGPKDMRDWIVQEGKDLQRSVDYLETRDDIDTSKLAFCGISMGANWGPIFTAVEDRFAASLLFAGNLGRHPPERPPESIMQNFAPRSTVPVLMVNGRNDFWSPIETNIKPMFDMQGAPAEHKKLVILEGGHLPESPKEVFRAALDWLDLYLGPVD